jgi:hypothetical protein
MRNSFEVLAEDLADRIESVQVIIWFNEGYAASSGECHSPRPLRGSIRLAGYLPNYFKPE